jgi:hypothetical protein
LSGLFCDTPPGAIPSKNVGARLVVLRSRQVRFERQANAGEIMPKTPKNQVVSCGAFLVHFWCRDTCFFTPLVSCHNNGSKISLVSFAHDTIFAHCLSGFRSFGVVVHSWCILQFVTPA